MNIHTYLEKRASKNLLKKLHNLYVKGTDIATVNAIAAVQSGLRPIYTAKGMKYLIKEPEALPGVAAGYAGLGYGAYKGGKKIKKYLQDKKRGK